MSQAVTPPMLTPEAVAIIKAGTPKPQTPNAVLTPVVPAASLQPPAVTLNPVVESAQEPVKTEAPRKGDIQPSQLASLYARVPVEIQMALLKASSDRKLKHVTPFTQQDIVTEALSLWLKKNKYLS